MVRAGKVRVDGRIVREPDVVVKPKAKIEVEGKAEEGRDEKVYLMLNKPSGLVTTTRDEHGRDTVYACFANAALPRIIPVGRLDKASEGLLLFTNDNNWAARVTDPGSGVPKTYHVQIDCVADDELIARIKGGEEFPVRDARVLRRGDRNSWLEIVLEEGKNRHIRRLLEALRTEVLRLVRIRIGGLELGGLAKGKWRHLTPDELPLIRGK